MEPDFEKNDTIINSGHAVHWTELAEKIPMHPDDFNALLYGSQPKDSMKRALRKAVQTGRYSPGLSDRIPGTYG
jgi:hypothetical protein